MNRYLSCAIVAIFTAFTALPNRSYAQLEDLAARVPSTANALVLIDADKILKSDPAVQGDWKSKIKQAHAAGLTLLPANAKQAVFASELDLDLMAPLWQASIGKWSGIPDTKTIAEKTGGSIDNVGGVAAVQLQGDAYVLHFTSDIVGFMTPANRQSVGRWIREVLNQEHPRLSPYLMEAYGFANDRGTPLIMAIDLHDAVTQAGVQARLEARWKDSGMNASADLPAIAKVLASIRGATLGVTFNKSPFGALKVDFEEDVAPIADISKDLLLHILNERGAFINEFEDWKVVAQGKQVKLEGNMTASGLRRLLSVFDRPPVLTSAAEPVASAEMTAEQRAQQSSLSYFHSVDDLLKDLKHEPKRQGNNYTAGSMTVWYDNYARKIDNLPILNVDPYLLDYGAGVAKTLRQASSIIKTGGVQSKSAELNAPYATNTYSYSNTYGYSYRAGFLGAGYVPYGSSGSTTVVDQRETTANRARIRSEYRNSSIASARTLIDSIDEQRANARREMTQKLQVEFK